MPLTSNLQLSIELTNVFGLARQAASATQALVAFARQLRSSGSDIIVEEDLADVFGRMRIERTIETEFKKRVLVETTIVPLYQQCEIQLQHGPGPTVQRAFRDQDRRYLSTVVQLSMLASLHDRTQLASAISESLTKRSATGIPGANISPGFEGISRTLEACASQTSGFVWYRYTQSVLQRLWEALEMPRDMATFQNIGVLRQDILLAAMDYLCLVQSLPEDRKMVVHVVSGCVPLIVWAHHVLGLTVQMIWRHKDLWFGKGDPQVIIHPGSRYGFEKIEGSTYSAASLLDSQMEVVIAQEPQIPLGVKLRSQERHTLSGLGTEYMRRYFSSGQFNINSSVLLYTETAQLIAAFAICKGSTLHRVRGRTDAPTLVECLPCLVDLEQWRILDGAAVLFQGILLDHRAITSYVKRLATFKSEDLSARDLTLPTSLEAVTYLEGEDKDLEGENAVREDVDVLIATLTALLLNVAHVKDPQKCHELPVILDFGDLVPQFGVGFEQLLHGGRIPLEESTVFYGIASLLLGPTFESRNHEKCFLISDWGWSVFLSCCDDCDPATIRPELVSVHKGVPTNLKTQERKMRMADFGPSGLSTDPVKILDKDGDYMPRCVTPVNTRTEYYTSRVDTFLLDIRFKYDEFDSMSAIQGIWRTSYRSLHASVWEIHSTSRDVRCRHPKNVGKKSKLNLDVVTVGGYGWGLEMKEPLKGSIPERICISLVAGDHRARWLVTENAAKSKERKTMLRENVCCPDCAIQTLAKLEGKWILIL